nr:hypothetical protein [Nanoarchaeum sp.]
MKKGFVHIDWVISFGIFIVFLLLIFIWFGPAFEQNYDNDYLKTIAEQGFETETYVNVLEYPIYFESSTNLNNQVINVSLPTNKNIDDINKLFLLNNANQEVTQKKIENGVLYFTVSNFIAGVNKYTFYYSDGINSSSIDPGATSSQIYGLTLGVGKEYFAFSNLKFAELQSLNYNDFKKRLKYPGNKDISIFIYSEENVNELLYNYSVIEPSENQNVYVMRMYSKMINQTGRINYVVPNIRTW